MKLNVYTVFDKVDGSASQLFLARSDGRIVRDFVAGFTARNKQVVANGGTAESLDDFSIRRIGYFDDELCRLIPSDSVVIPFSVSEDASVC